jgi:hypothetical protein
MRKFICTLLLSCLCFGAIICLVACTDNQEVEYGGLQSVRISWRNDSYDNSTEKIEEWGDKNPTAKVDNILIIPDSQYYSSGYIYIFYYLPISEEQ